MNTENEMKIVTSEDGTDIAYKVTGSGPPLVLLHGSGVSDHRRWEIAGVRPSLAEHFTVYAIDRRGRGMSGDAEEYAFDREVEDVVAVVEGIDQPVTLLGHSYGALIALERAFRTDNIGKLILYEPLFSIDKQQLTPDKVIHEMNDLLDDGKNEHALIFFCREIGGLTPEEIDTFRASPGWQDRVEGAHTLPREEQASAEYEFHADRFKELTVPTLLISGSESPKSFKDVTKALHESLPDSRISVFEGEKHVAMNNVPDRFIEEVVSFIRESR
jgi:pimeloyl-ACP methyl ester carboxylesterase